MTTATTTDVPAGQEAQRRAERIAREVGSWPTLSPADQARLALLLAGGSA